MKKIEKDYKLETNENITLHCSDLDATACLCELDSGFRRSPMGTVTWNPGKHERGCVARSRRLHVKLQDASIHASEREQSEDDDQREDQRMTMCMADRPAGEMSCAFVSPIAAKAER